MRAARWLRWQGYEGPRCFAKVHLWMQLSFPTHSATATHTYRIRMTSVQRPFDVLIASGFMVVSWKDDGPHAVAWRTRHGRQGARPATGVSRGVSVIR